MILRCTQLISGESHCVFSPLSLARFGAKQIPSILHSHHYFAPRNDNGKAPSQSTSAATDGLTHHDSIVSASAPSPPPPPPPHSLKGSRKRRARVRTILRDGGRFVCLFKRSSRVSSIQTPSPFACRTTVEGWSAMRLKWQGVQAIISVQWCAGAEERRRT